MDNLTPVIDHLKNKKYEDGITLITLTGDRHICFERCKYYLEKQTYASKVKQWIIVDDDYNKLDVISGEKLTYLLNNYCTKPVKNFISKLRAGLINVKYNKVLIIEDDDWYASNYIELYAARLEKYQLVGECPARYYHVGKRVFKIWGADSRASLCQTGFKASIIPTVYLCTYKQDSPFVDYRLWQKTSLSKFLWQDECHCVGIKGMPGRGGIGAGHRARHGYKSDKDLTELAKWIGREDAEFYRQFYELNQQFSAPH